VKVISKSVTAGLLLAASSFVAASLPVLAQDAPVRADRPARAPDTTPLAEPNMAAIIKGLGLVESRLPAREFIKGWRKPKKIVVVVDANTHRMDWLKEVVPADVQLVAAHSIDEAAAALADADGLIGNCSRPLIAAAGPNFHWAHVNYAGVEACFAGGEVPARLRDGSIAVTNSQRVTGDAVAGHAIALMMALSRGLDQYVRQDVAGKFNTEPYPRLISLQGKTILIAGLGGVGTAMANMAHGLGMRVIATNAVIPANAPDYIEHIGLPDELGAMAGQADVVMSALPLTPQTAGLFNAAMFAKFKKGAIFINVTRPGEHVEADLAAALDSGQLSSAGVDDPNPNSPLVHAKNMIFTPYVASQNVDSTLGRGGETIWAVARENLRRYAAGEKLLSVVDPIKGF
jgi:phosphoglycerate dehydrogenase-like enzyme